MNSRFFECILSRRITILIFYVLFTVGFGVLSKDVQFEFSVEQFFPAWDANLKIHQLYKNYFPREDGQFRLFLYRANETIDEQSLRDYRQAAALFAACGLKDIVWLGTLEEPLIIRDGYSISIEPRQLVQDNTSIPQVKSRFQRFQDDVFLEGLLWNASHDVFVVGGTIPPSQNNASGRGTVEACIDSKLGPIRQSQKKAILSGLPAIRTQYIKELQRDQVVYLGGGFLLLFVLMYFCLRSSTQIFLAFISIIPACLFVTAVMRVMGIPITALTSAIPLIIVVLGISDTIHLLVHFRKSVAAGLNSHQAVVKTFTERCIPCFFTSLTTAIGFLSLVAVRISIIVEFAVFTAVGVMVAYVVTMLVLPTLLSFYHPAGFNDRGINATLVNRIIKLAQTLPQRHGSVILVGTTIICAVSVWAAFGLKSNTYMIDDFKPSHPLMRDLRWIEDQGFGLFQINVLMQGDASRRLDDQDNLAWLKSFEEKARAEGTGLYIQSISLASGISFIRHRFDGTELEVSINNLTDSELVRYLFSEKPELIQRYLQDVYLEHEQVGQIAIFVRDAGSLKTKTYIDRLQAYLQSTPPPAAAYYLTGTLVLAQTALERIPEGLGIGLLFLVAVLFVLMVLLFRSFTLGIIAMIPNLVPLIILFGILRVLNYDIKPSTVLVFSISLGIAVDDTIHALGVIRSHIKQSGGLTTEIINRSLRESGPPIMFTSLVIGGGFLALTLSRIELLSIIGILTVTAMVIALFCDLFLLPALLHLYVRGRPTSR